MSVLDPGLPHGRLWVAERGCTCDLCAARSSEVKVAEASAVRVRVAERAREERIAGGWSPRPRPVTVNVTFHKNSHGQYVVRGPVDQVRVGTVQARNMTTGRVREVYVHRLGRVFTQDGVNQRYGYIRR